MSCCGLKFFCEDILTSLKNTGCWPKKKTKSQEYFEDCLREYKKEVEIVYIIKELRFLKAATRALMSSKPQFEKKASL